MDEALKTTDLGTDIIKDEIVRRLLNNEADYVSKNGNTYDVQAKNLNFRCSYSDDEINEIADLCVDLLDELWQINDKGYNREDLIRNKGKFKGERSVLQKNALLYSTYMTERTDDIIDKIGATTKADEAYCMFISKPAFISGVNSVYEVIIDRFEDAEMYFSALFMLARVAMHMNCEESTFAQAL